MIRYRLATIDQIHHVLEMMAEFNAIDGYSFEEKTSRDNLAEFIGNFDLGRLWLIYHGTAVVGYVVLTFGYSFEYMGRDAFVDELYLKPTFRGRGIGRDTMEFVEKRAFELGVKALHLEVEQGNDPGLKLYQNRDFRVNDRFLMTKRMR